MPDPWQSLGADQAVLREKRVVIQNSDGTDAVRLGKDDDGHWTLTFLDNNGLVVLRSGEFADGLYGMQAVDPSGNERVRVGELSDSDYGFKVNNNQANTIYKIGNEGQSLPYMIVPMGTTGGFAGMGITNGTYGGDGIYYADWYCTGPNVLITWGASFPGSHSSTMDVRVRAYVNGAYTTMSETTGIATSTTGTVDKRLPDGAVGTVIRLQVEARRASGSDLLGLQIVAHPRNY